MDLNIMLFHTHSGLRWLVVLATVVALVYMLLGLVRKTAYTGLAHRIMIIFSGLITLQWVVGLILLLVRGTFAGYEFEHALTMTIAVGVSHMHMRFRRAADSVRYRNGLLIVVAVLVLVYIGVARLPQGWSMAMGG
jgi:hypothetical protein